MKKIIALFSLVLITITVIFAGGGNQRTTTGGGSTGPVPDDLSKTLEITWFGYNIPGMLPQDNSIIQREIEKRYNVKINNVPVDMQNAEQTNLYLATGGQFDFWTWNTRSLQIVVNQGIVRPLSEEMVKKYAPGIVKILETASSRWVSHGSYEKTFYGIPHMNANNYTPIGLSVRTEWLENLGVTALPKTLDELETLFTRFVNDDPDKNGRKDTYALSLFGAANQPRFLAPYLFASYGVNFGTWGAGPDGSPTHWAIQDEFRQALIRLSEWWAKGYYDPEILTATRNENMERFARGQVGGYFYSDWALVASPNSGTVGWYLLQKQNPQMNADTISTFIPPVSGPKGTATLQQGNPLGGMSYFGNNTSDEKVIRILRIINDTATDKDMYLLRSFGFEGEHYTLNSTGQVMVKPEWSSGDKLAELGKDRFGIHTFSSLEMKPFIIDEFWNKGFVECMKYPFLPLHAVNSFGTPEEREFGADIATVQDEYFWKAVTGEWNVNNTWNDYVRRWTTAGGQKIIDAKKQIARDNGLN